MPNTNSAYNRAKDSTEFRELRRHLAELDRPQMKVRVLRTCGIGGKVVGIGETVSLPRLTALELIGCHKAERVDGK